LYGRRILENHEFRKEALADLTVLVRSSPYPDNLSEDLKTPPEQDFLKVKGREYSFALVRIFLLGEKGPKPEGKYSV
jgi:hypothetical protein